MRVQRSMGLFGSFAFAIALPSAAGAQAQPQGYPQPQQGYAQPQQGYGQPQGYPQPGQPPGAAMPPGQPGPAMQVQRQAPARRPLKPGDDQSVLELKLSGVGAPVAVN